MKTKQQLIQEAELNAVDRRFNKLKIFIPCGIAAWPLVYSFAGFYGVGGMGLFAIGAIANAYRQSVRDWRQIAKGDREIIYQCTREENLDALNEAFKQSPTTNNQQPTPPALPPAIQDASMLEVNDFLNVNALLRKGTSIGLFGDSGSGKTTLAKTLLSACSIRQNMSIIVIDPDFDQDKHSWGNATVLSDYDLIFTIIPVLIKWLKAKNTYPLTIFLDELTDLRLEAESRGKEVLKMLDDFVLRYAVRGRKYQKVLIIGTQSSNVEAIGLKGKGDYLQSFTIIRLGDIAKKHSKTLPNRNINTTIQSIAYPVLLGDSELFLHPNLGHYSEVADNNKPKDMHAIVCRPLFSELQEIITSATSGEDNPQTPIPPASPPVPPVNTTSATSGDLTSATTRHQIEELIELGYSDNVICNNFGATKNSQKYHELKAIIREIRGKDSTTFSGII